MPFTYGTLRLRTVPYDSMWRTEEALVYQGERDRFVIPKGAWTDLATIPRLVRWLLDVDAQQYREASVLHDWLCVELGRGTCSISSHDVDGLFRRVARELGTPPIARWLLWVGVRWGALANKRRRKGWLRDAPLVVLLSLLALPLVVLPSLSGWLGRAVYVAAEAVVKFFGGK